MAIPQMIPATKKKNRKPLIITLISVMMVLVIVLVMGLCTNWFGMVSPLNGLIQAVQNTVCADNLTVKSENVKIYADWDREDGKPVVLVDAGYSSELYKNGKSYYYSGDYAYVGKLSNKEESFETLVEATNDSIDLDKALKALDLDDYLDGEDASTVLQEFYTEYLCDEQWLEDTLGFTKDGDTYIFQPDLRDLCKDVNNFCQDADAFDSDTRDTIEELIDELLDEVEKKDIEIKIEVVVDGDYVSEIDIEYEYRQRNDRLLIKIDDVNTTEFDSEVEELENNVEQWIEDNTCEVCNEVMYYEVHGTCAYCGEHASFYPDESEICYECLSTYDWIYCPSCDGLCLASSYYCPHCNTRLYSYY